MELTYENIERGLSKYQRIIQFDNGYGFSIISHDFSIGGAKGLFEIALLDDQGVIMYEEELGFGNTVGNLDFHEVALLINAVSALPPRDKSIRPNHEVCW
jgi:hypothetical protein